MASTQGKEGKVKLDTNAVAGVQSWNLDIERDQLDDSELGTEWRAFLNGIGQWSGSIETKVDPADTNGQLALINALINGTQVTSLDLYTDLTNTKGFTGAANIANLGVSIDFESIESGSYGFQGSGVVAYTASLS